MDPPHQGIPTLPSSLPYAEPFRHLESYGSGGCLPRFQPGTLETKENQTCSPSQSSRVLQRSRHISSNGGVTIKPPEAFNAPGYQGDQSLRRLPPASPSRTANIRIRRSQHGSALLQSPARAGHTARMKQIFEDAGCEYNAAQAGGSVLYPRLPNISRKASPLPVHNRELRQHNPSSPPADQPESPCLPINPFLSLPNYSEQNPSRQSQHTSGSWSDDSGYFIADSRGRASTLAALPKERIYDWLQNIPLLDGDDEDDHPSLQPLERFSTDVPDTQVDIPSQIDKEARMSQTWRCLEEPTPSEDCRPPDSDPFLCDDPESNLTLFSSPNPATEQPPRIPFRGLLRQSARLSKRADTTQSARVPNDADANSHTIPSVPSTPIPHAEKHGLNTCTNQTPDEPIELSPLSPNVCIERGPSRYHANRRSVYAGSLSPGKAQSFDITSTPQLQENSGRRQGRLSELGSPLASRCKPLGSRF